MTPTPAQVMSRLEAIETDLGERQVPYAEAATNYYRAKRDFEHAWAVEFIKTEGKNKEERESKVIVALYESKPYKELVVAEAAYEGQKAAVRTLETRANIGMSLLKSLTRVESPAQPSGQTFGRRAA